MKKSEPFEVGDTVEVWIEGESRWQVGTIVDGPRQIGPFSTRWRVVCQWRHSRWYAQENIRTGGDS